MDFRLPPVIKNHQHETRKVGFELEFVGLDLDAISALIINIYGGEHKKQNKFHQTVENSRIGTFNLELDARLLRDKLYENFLKEIGINISEFNFKEFSLQSEVENILEYFATTVVPYEVSTPPIPIDQIKEVNALKEALQKNKAMGTKASWVYAFGLHINPEVPDLKTETLLNYIRAFLLLYSWIFKASNIDFTRRVTPFIDQFPKPYLKLVLDQDYNPDLERLVEDYYYYNPTRNRPLDMYPVFAWLLPEKINNFENMGIVKPRPTFHYRLPNCLIDDKDWSIATEWNYWVEVENLANNQEKIRNMSEDFNITSANNTLGFQEKWVRKTNEWLQ